MTTLRYGAEPSDWDFLSLAAGMTTDLLPAVANPNIKISPRSKMKQTGKTPGTIIDGHAFGFSKWTEHEATDIDIAAWKSNANYSICIQTRTWRAIDIDIDDADKVAELVIWINSTFPSMPMRYRSNSPKILLVYKTPGFQSKKVIQSEYGNIDLLASGQQFIACGTHTSGERYKWLDDELPLDPPTLNQEQLDILIAGLCRILKGTVVGKDKVERSTTAHVDDDPVFEILSDRGMVYGSGSKSGSYNIECPFKHEHSVDSGETETQYYPAHTGGYDKAVIKCLHGHCEARSFDDFRQGLGIDVAAEMVAEFADIPHAPMPVKKKLNIITDALFSDKKELTDDNVVDDVISKTSLTLVYGPSGSSKTAFILDLAYSAAAGGVFANRFACQKKAVVVYIAAEGAQGVRKRVAAMRQDRGLTEDQVRLYIIPDTVNFHRSSSNPRSQVNTAFKELEEALREQLIFPDIVIIDTLSAATVGIDENLAKEMSVIVADCYAFCNSMNTALIVAHHTGKNAESGARGSSVLLSNSDTLILISPPEEESDNVATLIKQKDAARWETPLPFKLKLVTIGEKWRAQLINGRAVVREDGSAKLELVPDQSIVVDWTNAKLPLVQPVKIKKGTKEDLCRLIIESIESLVEDHNEAPEMSQVVALCSKVFTPVSVMKEIDRMIENRDIHREAGRLSVATLGDRQIDGFDEVI